MNKPNIIYIYADDLGRGMLSCFGQRILQTPNIDRLAQRGMLFRNYYATTMCAPARASLHCGIHDARQGRWSYNKGGRMLEMDDGTVSFEQLCEQINNETMAQRDDGVYLGTVLQRAGYFTAQVGKLDWGFTTTPQQVVAHGWDYHCGYYDHDRCHGYYPPYLFRNGERFPLEGNTRSDCGRGEYTFDGGDPPPKDMSGRRLYSQDVFDDEIERLIDRYADADKPLFLLHSSQLPHGPVFYDRVYPQLEDNKELSRVEKEYASMVLRLDETVGKILAQLERKKLLDSTMIIFSSDNGHGIPYMQSGRVNLRCDSNGNAIDNIDHAVRSHLCGDVFNGNDSMAGIKCSNWDGGARVPLLVSYLPMVEPGSSTDELVSAYDLMATLADWFSVPLPNDKDSVSFLGVLRGGVMPPQRRYVVYGSPLGPALVTRDGWKLRTVLRRDKVFDYCEFDTTMETMQDAYTFRLYYLPDDYAEENDLSHEAPEKLDELLEMLLCETTGNLANGMTQVHYRISAQGWRQP